MVRTIRSEHMASEKRDSYRFFTTGPTKTWDSDRIVSTCKSMFKDARDHRRKWCGDRRAEIPETLAMSLGVRVLALPEYATGLMGKTDNADLREKAQNWRNNCHKRGFSAWD